MTHTVYCVTIFELYYFTKLLCYHTNITALYHGNTILQVKQTAKKADPSDLAVIFYRVNLI